METEKKYKLTDESINFCGRKLYRIEALKDFSDVEKGEKGGEKLKKSAGNSGIFLALLIFVGIPLPGTGAWTGTLAASFLNLDFKTSIFAITLGVLLAGIIMSLGSKIVAILGWVGVFAIIAVILVIVLISILIKKKK